MPRLRYLARARHDLVDLLGFITRESGSLAVGQQFVARLREKCAHLASLPGRLGRPRPELRDDIRSFAFHGYVIFFRYVDDRLEVVAILNGSRDVDRAFPDEGSAEGDA